MTRQQPSTAASEASPFRVELPRASDAIGLALRDAYSGEPMLPDDMRRLLAMLDRSGASCH